MGSTSWTRRVTLAALGVVALVLLLAGTVGTGVSMIDGPASDLVSAGEDALSNEPLDEHQIKRAVHEAVNEERQARGLPPISLNDKISAVARQHSGHMASRGYFSHTSPSGDDHSDRYAAAGIRCGSSAENIAWTVADGDVSTDSGTVDHDRNETSIANGLVRQWMNSPRHRDILLSSDWYSEGIGIATAKTDMGTRVYATQNFCEEELQ